MSRQGDWLRRWARSVAIVMLGVVIPLVVLTLAYVGLFRLTGEIRYQGKNEEMVQIFKNVRAESRTPDDYRLFSLLYSEAANQKTMINKQILKVSIMQIGFAVVSVGMMFIVLGIRDGGAEGAAGNGEISFNFKIGSTGVVMILVGAAMSTAGGVMPNEYSTVDLPVFGKAAPSDAEKRLNASIEAYKGCSGQGDAKNDCFVDLFKQINLGD